MFVACMGRGTFEMGRARHASPLRPAARLRRVNLPASAAAQPFLAPLRPASGG